MEDKLAEFVLGQAKPAAVSFIPKLTLAAIPGLAEAVMQTNGLFILAKIPVKCSIVTFHYGGRYDGGKAPSVSVSNLSCLLVRRAASIFVFEPAELRCMWSEQVTNTSKRYSTSLSAPSVFHLSEGFTRRQVAKASYLWFWTILKI